MNMMIKNYLYFSIVSLLIFPVMTSRAQTTLNGIYVAEKVSYLSGDELPDDNILKYTYVKYTFSNANQINISGVYSEKGTPMLFEINGNRLILKNEEGSIMNTLKILESSADKLVLVSSTARGELDDPWALRYTLYKEEIYQKNIPLSADDIFSIKGTDTIYKAGRKIHAKYKGASFQNYLYEYMRKKNKEVKSGELISTFIIDTNGLADSLKIIQGINPKFDQEYIKAFNSVKGMWQPAWYNDKSVKVQMTQNLKYLTSEQTLPSYFSSQQANTAYKKRDYETALYYYDKALDAKGDEMENLYRRGICKQILGNLKGACEDWNKIKSMGINTADQLLLKFCK
jgi:hypothetical protein